MAGPSDRPENSANRNEINPKRVMERGSSMVRDVKESAQELGEKATQRGEQILGMAGDYASQAQARASEAVGAATEYFRNEGVSGMAEDVATIVKRYPLPAVLIGFGLGFMLASRR